VNAPADQAVVERARDGVDRDRRGNGSAGCAAPWADERQLPVVEVVAVADDDHTVDVAALGRRRRRERLHLRALAHRNRQRHRLRSSPVLHNTVLPCWSWFGQLLAGFGWFK
jgi:hypothetical protein